MLRFRKGWQRSSPPTEVAEVAQNAVSDLRDELDAESVSLFLFSKAGTLVRAAVAPANDVVWPTEYASDDPGVARVVGNSVSGAGRPTRWSIAARLPEQSARFGSAARVLDLPLDGPNRTFGFVRVLTKGPVEGVRANVVQLRVRHAALMISSVRRKIELDSMNTIRELIGRPKPPVEEIFDTATKILVADWTEFSVALIRTRSRDGKFRLAAASCAGGLSLPPSDHEPREWGQGLVGRVASTGRPIFVNDISNVPLMFRDSDWIHSNGFRAFACLPIQRGTQTAGTLSVFIRFRYRFYWSKKRFMRSLCEHLSTALTIERLRLSMENSREITNALLNQTSREDDILKNAVAEACQLLGGDFGYIAVASKNDRSLHPIAWTEPLSLDVLPALPLNGPGLTPEVFRTRSSINCADVRSGECAKLFVDLKPPFDGRVISEIVVPMMHESEVVGVIDIESILPNHFTSEDQTVLETVASHATLVHHKHRLYRSVERLASLRFAVQDRVGLYQSIVDAASDIAAVTDVVLWTVDSSTSSLKYAAARSTGVLNWAAGTALPFNAALGPLWEAMTSLKPILVEGVEQFSGCGDEFRRAIGRFGAVLVLPIATEDTNESSIGSIGVICLFLVRPCRFSSTELSVLVALSNAVALALRDASNREALEAAYNRAVQNATLLSVAEIAAGVAHDVRNVLNIAATAKLAIAGTLSKHLEGERLERARSELSKLDASFEQLRMYFDRLRHYARFAAPHFVNVDLNDILINVLDLLDYRISRMNIKVKRDLRPVPHIRGDQEQLIRAFTNIIFNSLDAMKQRGNLFVGTDIYQNERYVRIRIIDDGVGMDNDLRSRVFEPYVTTKTHGTGMGLPIVKQIVEQVHGGAVDLESKRGQGTTVEVLLPNTAAEDEE